MAQGGGAKGRLWAVVAHGTLRKGEIRDLRVRAGESLGE